MRANHTAARCSVMALVQWLGYGARRVVRKPRLERPRPRRPLISSWPGREINRNTVILSRARQHSTTGYENTTFSWGRQLAKAPHQGAPRPSVAFGAMHASLFSTHRASIPVCVASRPPAPRRGTAVRVVARGAECELHVDAPRRDGSTPTRRDLLAGTVGLFAGSSLFPTPRPRRGLFVPASGAQGSEQASLQQGSPRTATVPRLDGRHLVRHR